MKEQPPQLSEDQRARILALSSDLPALWDAPETTAADRKEIIRLVVERVEVHVRAETECGEVVISWRGGVTTRHEIIRTVSRYESLGRYDQLMDRIIEMRQEGQTIKQIAARLNAEGYRTPRSRKGYTSTSVRKLLSRAELTRGRIATQATRSPRVVAAGPGPGACRCQRTSSGTGPCVAGSAPGRSRRAACGSSGPMAGNDSGCGSSGRPRNGASLQKTTAVSQEDHPLMILDPIDPRGADRWDRGFVTKEALCRAHPDWRFSRIRLSSWWSYLFED